MGKREYPEDSSEEVEFKKIRKEVEKDRIEFLEKRTFLDTEEDGMPKSDKKVGFKKRQKKQ